VLRWQLAKGRPDHLESLVVNFEGKVHYPSLMSRE
jgi:hypothetical protein